MGQMTLKVGLILAGLVIGSFADGAETPATRLKELVGRAMQTESDSLLVIQDGKVIAEKYSSDGMRKQLAYSITKSMVSLGVGFLIDEGKISSIDVPVYY